MEVREPSAKYLAKPAYKRTEVGVIPEEWETDNMLRISRQIMDYRGRTPKKLGMDWGGGDIPALSAGNVKKGFVDFNQECYFGSDALYSRWMTRGDVAKDDILFTTEAPLGNVALVPDNRKYILSQRTVLIQVDPQRASRRFLFQMMLSDGFQRMLTDFSSGSTAKGIKRKKFEQLCIALPPLPEQRAIAAALGDMDALLGGLEQLIAKKRDLKQAAMQQLLTGQTRLPGFSGEWEVKRLGELLAYEQPTNYLVSSSEYSDSNDIPVLTAGKTFLLGYTNEGEGIFSNLPVIIFDDFTTATKYVTFPFKAKSSAMKLLKPRNPSVNLRLVYEMMQLIEFKLSEHKRYWISEYQKLEIKLPDEKEQTAIAAVLADMDAELSALAARRDKTRDLKQAMMQELLTGRTRLV